MTGEEDVMKVRRWIPFVSLAILSLVLTTATHAQDGQLWVGPNVNMVSGTTWPDGDPFLQRQNEPSIAVSTRDTMRLVGFTNDYRSVDLPGLPVGKETGDAWLGVYKSLDGGMTWRSTLLPGYPQDDGSTSPIHGYEAGADPVVRAGTHGLFYLTGIVFDRGDPARSALFMTRYMDLDNRESGDPIEFIDTGIVKANMAGDSFIDKPWMAVDIPRAGAQSVELEVYQDGSPVYQNVQCGNVYLAWAEIFGVAPNQRSTIMFSSSSDCGTTWSAPIPLSDPDTMNQGVSIAISPDNGDVWVAWRQFETDPTYLVCANGGGYWKTHPEEWPLDPIEMGGVTYTKIEALDKLNTPPKGDATYILAKQLIPAKLNLAAHLLVGDLQDLIDAADAWLVVNLLGSKPKGAARDEGLALKDQLEAYNEGEWVTEGCTTSVLTPGTGNAIVGVRSTDSGFSFGPPTEVSTLSPFEQATTPYSFRTNAYPTITVDNAQPFNRAYIAWATRGLGIPRDDDVEGDARIVVSTSTDGMTWTIPDPIDQPEVPGHQIVPSITFAGGKVVVVYYDLRRDMSGVFDRFIADFPVMFPYYRHTVEVRAAHADPTDYPVFTQYDVSPGRPSGQVSRYLFLADYGGWPSPPEYTDTPEYIQMQFNPPNLTIYLDGTRPFFGDYVDIGASPAFLPNPDGSWRYNTEAADGAAFHAVWTDNRDIEAPYDGNWGNYVVPGGGGDSVFDSNQTVPACDQVPNGEGQTKIRDQNTYTARLTSGLFVGSPGGSRPIGALQRAFVVTVRNDSEEIKIFRLTIDAPVDVTASFEQFTSTPLLDLHIAPYSGATRTVFVTSPVEDDSRFVRVDVTELGGDGLTGSVLLNGDPSSPPPTDAGLLTAEHYTPAMMNRTLDNPAMMNPAMMNLAMMNLAMMNPAMMNLAMMNPAMMNPAMMNLAMMNPAMMNTPLDEITWEVKNDGTASAGYSFNLLGDNAPDPALGEFIYQLFIYREYKTPAADGCDLIEAIQQQELVNVLNPEILDRDTEVPGLWDPENQDTDLDNPTFYLDPGDTAFATLVIVDLDPLGGEDFGAEDIWASIVAQAVDTDDAAGGDTDPDFDTDFLIITTTALADATAGVPYAQTLTSTDGLGPPTWTLVPGSNEPPGTLTLSGAGLLSGTVTLGGTYQVTVQVSDTYEVDEKTLTLQVNEVNAVSPSAPDATPIGGLVETSITVLVEDGNGDPLPGYEVTLQLASHPNGGTAHDNVATTAADGIATFDSIWFDRTGDGYELIAEVALAEGVSVATAPSDPFDVIQLVVTTTAEDGQGSLRRCIENAERNVGWQDDISFNIAGPGPHTIAVLSPLPSISDSVIIDATTQTGYVDSPLVHLDGIGAGGNARGFEVRANNTHVRGFAVINFSSVGFHIENEPGIHIENNYIGTDGTNDLGNALGGIGANNCAGLVISGNVVSGNDSDGIALANGVTGAVVSDNKVGTNPAGDAILGNSGYGIRIQGANASGNTILNNLISGNGMGGLELLYGAHDNTIVGNLIGADVTGSFALPNTDRGLFLGGAHNNTIGGTLPTDRNVISGNAFFGMVLHNAHENVILGNFIGTDAGGTIDVGNGNFGIEVWGDSWGNQIGGSGPNEGNLISGNSMGVYIEAPAHDNFVEGNRIGTDATGAIALGNTLFGVYLRSAGNTVHRNVVGGNGTGIYLAYEAVNNTVAGNFVGIDATETVTIGNVGDGISIEHGATSNLIGGPNPGDGNVLAANGLRGIFIQNADTNTIQGNWIGTNSSLAGGLGNSNEGIVIVNADGTIIGGSAPNAGNTIINNGSHGVEANPGSNTRIEGNLISANSESGVRLYNHPGGLILGNRIGTDVSGTLPMGNTLWGIALSGSSSGNTIGGPGGRNIISGNNAGGIGVWGPGNLIEDNHIGTNTAGDAAIANFNTGGIYLASSGNTVRGNVISGNQTVGVRIRIGSNNVIEGNRIGTSAGGGSMLGNNSTGIAVGLFGSTITSTSIVNNLISANAGGGVLLDTGSDSAVVTGNLIGTDVTATLDFGNLGDGIEIKSGSHSNVLGGHLAHQANQISGNGGSGIQITQADDNSIWGNWIGTNSVLADLGNDGVGVSITSSDNTVVGTAIGAGGNTIAFNLAGVTVDNSSNAQVLGNVVSSNAAHGIKFGNFADGRVSGNHVGVDAGGTVPRGNGGFGIYLENNVTGVEISSNVASDNGEGIRLRDAESTTIISNFVGTDATGTVAIPNAQGGVKLLVNSHYNAIGGVGAGNVISGNQFQGLYLQQSNNNTIQGNFIGTNPSSSTTLGNTTYGIHFSDSSDNLIGGTNAGEGNVISSNLASGLYLSNAHRNTIQGNWIGTDPALATTLGNSLSGISIASSSWTIIGGTAAGADNVIAFNQLGIFISSGLFNSVVANSIFSNTALGFSLGPLLGVTPNDVGDTDTGPNDLLNYPVLTSAVDNGTQTLVNGSVDIGIPGASIVIEFYANPPGACDPSGHGEGQSFVDDLNLTTGPGGTVSFTGTLPTGLLGQEITATTRSALIPGDTSEFSACIVVTP